MVDLKVRLLPMTCPNTPARRTHLIIPYRFVDPVFSVGVGLTAAVLRIRREETERFPQQDNSLGGLWQKGVRMSKNYFGSG